MQDPIRYYITKRGEEPTVRSVKVAQGVPEGEDPIAPSEEPAAESKTGTQEVALVKSARFAPTSRAAVAAAVGGTGLLLAAFGWRRRRRNRPRL